MKKEFQALMEKIEPFINFLKRIKQAIINPKSAKIFRITYLVGWNFILLLSIGFLLVISLGFGVGAGYFASLVKDETPRSYEDLKKNIYNYEEPSQVYFANNVFMGTLRSDIIREEVKLEDISQYVIDALIATEDQLFYVHNGVVPKAVFRALFQEVSNSSTQTGGSTLTQQLVKNQILTNEVSFERKAKEILLALRIEEFFSKEDIIEAYLNVSDFGRNSSGQYIAGVQAAAKGVFGVDAKDLNLPQAAFIAGLPQSPNRYTPFTRDGQLKDAESIQFGLNRQKVVLERMYETGKITKKEYEDALKYDIVADFSPPQDTVLEKYPFLTMETERRTVDILMKVLYEKDGYTEEDIAKSEVLSERYRSLATRNLRQNGYTIYTTIDKDIYEKHQEIVKNFNKYPGSVTVEEKDPDTGKMVKVKKPIEVGMMMIENQSGRIISFVGGRDYWKNEVNHASEVTSNGRPIGSTMKPLLVYGPAIEMGIISPGSPIADVDHEFIWNNKPYEPSNYTKGKFYGVVSAREAIARSFNISAVQLMYQIFDQDPFQYIENMGLSKLKNQFYRSPAAALGSSSLSVEENTNAFATFANGGEFNDAYMIEKIVDKNGNVIYEHQPDPVKVFSEETAYLTLELLKEPLKHSNGTARRIPGLLNFSSNFYGKTGTSNDKKDIWFVGLNPNISMGIWMGYDQPKSVESNAHLDLWAALMNAAYKINPDLVGAKEQFKAPSGVVEAEYCTISGLLPSEACEKAGLVAKDYFNIKFLPKQQDDSLVEGKYVIIDGKKYLAKDTTPEEFSHQGFILNPEYIQRIAPTLPKEKWSQLIPDGNKWKDIIIPDDIMEENGKSPNSIQITLKNGTITWAKHSENDVIGYYVYRIYNGVKGEKVASIPADSNLSFKLPSSGQYVVTAVDIGGYESNISNIVQYGNVTNPGHDHNTGNDDNHQNDDDDDDDQSDDEDDDLDLEDEIINPFPNNGRNN